MHTASPGVATRPGEEAPPRRVVLLVNDLAGTGGAERQVFELATGLDRERFAPCVVLLKRRNDYAAALARAGVPVHALDRRGPADLAAAVRLRRVLRAQRPAVLHSFLFFSNLHAALLARGTGAERVVVSQRTSYETNLPLPLPAFWRRLARASYSFVDRVVFNSRAALEEEVAAGLARARTALIFNGVADDDPEARAVAATLRADAGLTRGPLAVAVGRLEEVKGHRHLLLAWAAARPELPAGARLVVVGDGAEAGRLKARARELGLGDSVLFVGEGPGRAWIAAADLLVQASLAEGLPNAVLEAMAESRAVVATAVGGVPDAVTDGETGWLVAPADRRAMAAALCAALTNDALRARCGAAGRRHFEARFTRLAMTRATEALYGELLGPEAE